MRYAPSFFGGFHIWLWKLLMIRERQCCKSALFRMIYQAGALIRLFQNIQNVINFNDLFPNHRAIKIKGQVWRVGEQVATSSIMANEREMLESGFIDPGLRPLLSPHIIAYMEACSPAWVWCLLWGPCGFSIFPSWQPLS